MRRSIIVTMNIMALLTGFSGIIDRGFSQDIPSHVHHETQHGFILGVDDKFASHLVANGHHSRQVDITGQLLIGDPGERQTYDERKRQSGGETYFLFQAQNLDLTTLLAGQTLTGHIVESKVGQYEPKNIIVRSAEFQIQNVLLNIPNPFFIDDAGLDTSRPGNAQLSVESSKNFLREKEHCCQTGARPCNWKC